MKKNFSAISADALETVVALFGDSSGVVDVLTDECYSTTVLATGDTKFNPFSRGLNALGNNLSLTNMEEGNKVTSNQMWAYHGLAVEVTSDGVLTDANLALLKQFMHDTVITFKVNTYQKFQMPLSRIAGSVFNVQSEGTVGSTNDNSNFTGYFDFRENPFKLGEQTSFTVDADVFTAGGVPAGLDGLKIRLVWDRTLVKLAM